MFKYWRFLMRYSYNKLWKLLIDKNMKKKDLESIIGIASSTIAKMSKEQPVSLEIIGRICKFFKCNVGDILDITY